MFLPTHPARTAEAEQIRVPIQRISPAGVHENTGSFGLLQLPDKLEVLVVLTGFPPGWHAMHIHEKGSCAPAVKDGKLVAGAAAGPHFDPTGVMNMDMDGSCGPSSESPDSADASEVEGDGSCLSAGMRQPSPPGRKPRPLGDLPAVFVGADGETRYRILTYKLRLEELRGRSVMLHAHQEAPKDPALPLGGGDRIACGLIEAR